MRINAQDRTVYISDESLVDPEAAHKEAVMLGAVMMYPEHPEKHVPYILAVQKSVVDLYNNSKEAKEAFYLDNPLLAARVATDSGEASEVLNRSTLSRKAGLTGSLAVRGSIAGQLLTILVDPNIPQATTLDATYAWYIDKFKTEYEVNQPTKSLLKAIWGEFKHVAHLWAAQQVYKTEYDKVLFQGFCNPSKPEPHQQAPAKFKTFLCIVSCFRGQIIELVNPSTKSPLIKDPFKAWTILTEDKKTFPILQPSRKKNL